VCSCKDKDEAFAGWDRQHETAFWVSVHGCFIAAIPLVLVLRFEIEI